MPEIHIVGEARYYWDQWSDGNTGRSRTVTMDTDITLTAQCTILDYQLTVNSSPITGITFTINGVPQTTPYTEWRFEGSYTLIMRETHNGYVWSHWLEDGDTNRTKKITLPAGTTWTAVYIPTPPQVEEEVPFWRQWWLWAIVAAGIVALTGAVYFLKKGKPPTPTAPTLGEFL